MTGLKKVKSALISVYHKENLEAIITLLKKYEIQVYSTGGTQEFLEENGLNVIAVESLTEHPSIFGGRVKTLHPKVFGGILQRRDLANDKKEAESYQIPEIDLVIVDLYPFEETLASGANQEEIIEKIDIGGIALIRAAAKNFKDVIIVASQSQYTTLAEILQSNEGNTTLQDRQVLAAEAFAVSSNYDTAIFKYFNLQANTNHFRHSETQETVLRYGENPHQKGVFYGNLNEIFEQIHGKALSYNNLVDVEAAVELLEEFDNEKTTFVIVKHTNACGLARHESSKQAYLNALAADNISAFGGIIATNHIVDKETAEELHKLFFEILIAPDFSEEVIEILQKKKKRILLKQLKNIAQKSQFKTLMNGVIWQDKDRKMELLQDLKVVTQKEPRSQEIEAMLFANKIAKHTKSNTIVLAKKDQMIASGVGQTSRVDALRQAITKARKFGFDLEGAVMASDAFFPFSDSVEIAHQAGVKAVLQPGGSIRDKDSIEFCDKHQIAMVFTGTRHFKH